MIIMSEREFDFIIFGADGMTGKNVLRNLVKVLELEKKPRWIAIAGRSKTQLKVALTEVSIQMDRNLNDIGLIFIDFNDESNLTTICCRSKVILNADNFQLNLIEREKLAKACIEKRTHLLDITDEPEYLDLLQLKYHEAAKASGVYLITSINSNCLPIDLGVDYLKQQFLPTGRLHLTESYITFQSKNQLNHHHSRQFNSSQPFNSYLINSILRSNHRKDKIIKEINNNNSDGRSYSPWISSVDYSTKSSLSSSSLKLQSTKSLLKYFPRKNSELSSWSIPISSHGIVWKSQQWFYQAYREPPTQFNQHLIVYHWSQLILIFITLIYLTLLTWFTFSRKLLNAYPSLLTFGYLKSTKDTEEGQRLIHGGGDNLSTPSSTLSSSFSIHLVGHGWDSPSDSSDGQYMFPPNKTMRVSISECETDCETTSLILIQSGLTLLEESSSMPYKGGCLTPAFAFRYTTLRDRLNQSGLEFRILHH